MAWSTRWSPRLDWLEPVLRGVRVAGTEYVHAGQLLYDDGRRRSTASRPASICAGSARCCARSWRRICSGRGPGPDAQAYARQLCPRWATPVPARLMDGVRLPATLTQILRQASSRQLEFLQDHHIDGALAFVDRIERAVG